MNQRILARLLSLAALAALAGAVAAGNCHAAEHAIRPGLWELTTTSPLLQLVPQIRPDQMRQLQDIARANGVALPRLDSGAAVARVCVTPQMARQNILPDMQLQQSGCHSSNANRSGNTVSVSIACDSSRLSGRGTARGTFTTPEHFSGKSTFSGEAQGMPIEQQAQTDGRWLQDDCKM